jgi:hypothetical protein
MSEALAHPYQTAKGEPEPPAQEHLFQTVKAEPVPGAYSFQRVRPGQAAAGLEREEVVS